MAAPLANYLRSPLAAARGRSGDKAAVSAFCRRALGYIRITITYLDWSWRRNMAKDATTKRRVWLNPSFWPVPLGWSLDRMDVPAQADLGITTIRLDGSMAPAPAVIPWADSFVTGTAPPGLNADSGCFIDYDDASARGWELLGMRKPSFTEAIALTWKSKPWIFGTPTFTPWDYQADEIRLRVGPQSLGHGGKRAGGKMKNVIRKVEIDAGVIEHGISMVTSKMNHGPTPTGGQAPRGALPSTRVEFPDRDPCPTNPTPAGYLPGQNFAHGQGFAHDLTDTEINQRLRANGHIGAALRSLTIILVAMRDYGWDEDESGCSPDDQIECDGPVDGLDVTTSITALDRVLTPDRIYALNPAA